MIRRGFTLIEILVVVSIIALLSSILIASLAEARARARDSKRVQDLLEVQKALELFYADHGRYPIIEGGAHGGFQFRQQCWECEMTGSEVIIQLDTTKLGVEDGNPPDIPKITDGILDNYLKPRPSDPQVPTGGLFPTDSFQGYVYKSSSKGRDYKMVLVYTVENIYNIAPKLRDPYFYGPTGNNISVYSSERSKYWAHLTSDAYDNPINGSTKDE